MLASQEALTACEEFAPIGAEDFKDVGGFEGLLGRKTEGDAMAYAVFYFGEPSGTQILRGGRLWL